MLNVLLISVVAVSFGVGHTLTYSDALSSLGSLTWNIRNAELLQSQLELVGNNFMLSYKATLQEDYLQQLEGSGLLSSLCANHLNATVKAATVYRENWAIRNTKVPTGIINGNLLWVGDYQECVNVTATVYTGPKRTQPTHPFTGQYCTTDPEHVWSGGQPGVSTMNQVPQPDLAQHQSSTNLTKQAPDSRLTPTYGLFIFLYVSLTRYLYNGPFWAQGGTEHHECRDSWWMNILYINNLFPSKQTCILWSWYLANDMQFYLIGPLLIVPLYLSGVLGLLVSLVFVLFSMVTAGVISMVQDLPINVLDGSGDTSIGPYVIGVVLGYFLYKTESRRRMSRVYFFLGHLVVSYSVAFVLSLAIEAPFMALEKAFMKRERRQ
ncbi:NRF6-like protein [Mya arenaria]|uniref:NRF6-like protein n=1 Tax=Mya arenaria TaxID=6604 RepID=A0ABY7DZH6_MYAAR|nr:NRF6-like protein [Mya arenaria]